MSVLNFTHVFLSSVPSFTLPLEKKLHSTTNHDNDRASVPVHVKMTVLT